MTDRRVEVEGIGIRYRTWGRESRPAVVLVHGLGGFLERWERNAEAFAERFRVVALDLPGCGLSDKPRAPYTIPWYARMVRGFAGAAGIERAHWVGHSLGGAICLTLAIHHPEMVDRLVIVSSAGLGRAVTPLLQVASVPFLGELGTRPSPEQQRRNLERSIHDPRLVTDEMVEIAYRMASMPGAQRSLLGTIRACIAPTGTRGSAYRPIRENLDRIRSQTLIVWGEHDAIVPLSCSRVALAGVPDADIHVFERCGHCPHIERRREFDALVADFLAKGSRGRDGG